MEKLKGFFAKIQGLNIIKNKQKGLNAKLPIPRIYMDF
jgi:hypothetical protein